MYRVQISAVRGLNTLAVQAFCRAGRCQASVALFRVTHVLLESHSLYGCKWLQGYSTSAGFWLWRMTDDVPLPLSCSHVSVEGPLVSCLPQLAAHRQLED